MAANNDSVELEALFDTVSADAGAAAIAAVPPPVPKPSAAPATGDSDDLQALFDSLATQASPQAVEEIAPAPVSAAPSAPGLGTTAGGDEWNKQEAVFNRIGHMARALHDTLGELGYNKLVEQAVALPDAKDRLSYVANLTEQAACKVLNATDIAVPLVEGVEKGAKNLSERWDKLFANQLSVPEFKALAEETRAYLKGELPDKTRGVHAQLTEIMMAQDFQDLTGQVIKKVVSLAQDLESGLMTVLIDVVPATKRTEEVDSLLNGPVVNAEGRTDIVVNQEQVDDLLDSLGF